MYKDKEKQKKAVLKAQIKYRKTHPYLWFNNKKDYKEYIKKHNAKYGGQNGKYYKKYLESGKSYESSNKWRLKNINKVLAHRIINGRIYRGTLKRKSCEKCGNEKSDAHHPDYTKPLEVMWLCRKHHKELHEI